MQALLIRLFFLVLLSLAAVVSRARAGLADTDSKEQKNAFNALRKAIESEIGGYVHPSLGILSPAPSGATRGIGMINKDKKKKKQGDVLIKVPLSYQMTRNLALSTLSPLIPADVLYRLPLGELDDAALLVLLLAHERGLGKKSKFSAYINTLSEDLDAAGCGWAGEAASDFRKLPPEVEPEDIEAAFNYAYRVSAGMAKDYGEYLAKTSWPDKWKEDASHALLWSMCTVSSRGTVANVIPGDDAAGGAGIRLVPLADLANHALSSGGFVELSGKERISNGDFVDANEKDVGAFVVRAVWKCGTSRDMDKGDEVTVNYNLPHYTAVDWFISLGFIPPELSPKTEIKQGGEL